MQVLHFAALRQPTARLTTMAVYYNDNGDRSPLIEDVLQGHPDIPIQHTVVHLQSLDHGQVYTFCLSYRFNRLFLRNRALYALEPDMKWTGDMVVTKMGILNDYVNINAGRDRRVAVRAVYKSVISALLLCSSY